MILYGVCAGDTLETIAARFYDDPAQWRRIAEENHLVPPYISTDPCRRYGNPVSILVVENPWEAGSYYVYFPATDGRDIFLPGYRLYVEAPTIVAGGLDFEITEVASYDAAGRRVELRAPLTDSYAVGSLVYVFGPAYQQEMRVVGPGDTIRLPGIVSEQGESQPAAEFTLSGPEWEEAVGTDIKLDADGTLLWSTARRDVDTASGSDNMRQMVMGALMTNLGKLDHHPTYGSELDLLVGVKNDPARHFVMATYARQAVERDPRVAMCSDVAVVLQRDTALYSLTVHLLRTGALYRVENMVLRTVEEV